MSSYEVRLSCNRDDALNVTIEVAKVFGSIRSYVVDPLFQGALQNERMVIFEIAAQQGDPEDEFEESYYIDGNMLYSMIDKVRQAVPAIYGTHVIER